MISISRLSTYPRFETKARGNPEMAYSSQEPYDLSFGGGAGEGGTLTTVQNNSEC